MAVLLLLEGMAEAMAATWYVDASAPPSGNGRSWESAFRQIGSGINAATNGDTVLVAQGTYVEVVRFRGKNITLSSRNPADAAVVAGTIVDGNNVGSVVGFDGTEGPECVLTGFTIQHGRAPEAGGGIAGGSSSNRTHATIERNVISANYAPLYGGGVAYCDGTLRSNTIAICSSYDGGGLAYCGGPILGNVIRYNSADYKGGGVFFCSGLIQGNRVLGNNAPQGGGLVHCDGLVLNNTVTRNRAGQGAGLQMCNGLVRGNLVIENTATNSGGGLGACDGTNVSNVIAGNTAPRGGGLFGCDGAILNNTIVRNTATSSAGGIDFCLGTIANCIVWGFTGNTNVPISAASPPTNCCIQNWSGGGWGNITNDPVFADANGPDNNYDTYEDNDYHLGANSPCIDAGATWFLHPPGVDRDGNLRIVRWKYPVVVYVDMGAYEYGARPFAITKAGFTDWPPPGGRFLRWNSQPQDTYGVWVRSSVAGADWTKVTTAASQGETTSATDTGLLPWGWRARFYRVDME